jgi:hypothetical protein
MELWYISGLSALLFLRRRALLHNTEHFSRPPQLMDSWGQRMSVDIKTVKFLFEGNMLSGAETPEQLGVFHYIDVCTFIESMKGNAPAEMEDGDEIDAMLSQVIAPLTPINLNFKRELKTGWWHTLILMLIDAIMPPYRKGPHLPSTLTQCIHEV